MASRPVSAPPPMDLLASLRSLPPSKEVLEFYRSKVASFEREERRWHKRLAEAARHAAKAAKAEEKARKADTEVRALQRALVEMQGALLQERKRADKWRAAADREKVS